MISSMMHDLIYRPGHYRLHSSAAILSFSVVYCILSSRLYIANLGPNYYTLKVDDDEVVQNLNRKNLILIN